MHPALKQKIEEASGELNKSSDSAEGSNSKTLRDVDAQTDQLGWKRADWDVFSTPEKVCRKCNVVMI